VPPEFDVALARRGRNDYPRPFRIGERPSVGLAQLAPPIGMAVKDGNDRLAELCGEQAYAQHFVIGNGKGADGGRGVQRAEHASDIEPAEFAVAQQHAAAFPWERRVDGAAQLGAELRGDCDTVLRHFSHGAVSSCRGHDFALFVDAGIPGRSLAVGTRVHDDLGSFGAAEIRR